MFASNDITWRHESMMQSGASWDFDEFTPHITITLGEVPEDVEPYQGPIVLGPEIFEEIDTTHQNNIEEVSL